MAKIHRAISTSWKPHDLVIVVSTTACTPHSPRCANLFMLVFSCEMWGYMAGSLYNYNKLCVLSSYLRLKTNVRAQGHTLLGLPCGHCRPALARALAWPPLESQPNGSVLAEGCPKISRTYVYLFNFSWDGAGTEPASAASCA